MGVVVRPGMDGLYNGGIKNIRLGKIPGEVSKLFKWVTNAMVERR